MAPTKVVLIACGSFNPPTNMHLRMFEIARDHLHRLGSHVVVGGIISPVHDSYGKKELESSTHRLAMLKIALQNHDWIKLSDWECKQESWSRTKQVLQHHQNHINSMLNPSINNHFDVNEDDAFWIPENIKNNSNCDSVKVKLLCGGDLLESFGTPGLWADEDIADIVGQHGLVVITRCGTNPLEFIYNSDVLTKYMGNITIVTEWIRNEISSTKIRKALRRSESVRYLLHDKIIDYILKFKLYGAEKSKYVLPPIQSTVFLTPSPNDMTIEPPSPMNCMNICNNNLFLRPYEKRMSIDMVDSFTKSNIMNTQLKHPGQAVKIITDDIGEHKLVNKKDGKEVRKKEERVLKNSKSYSCFDALDAKRSLKRTNSGTNLKEYKSCDENLIKFIFTKHGIEVISDVETIV